MYSNDFNNLLQSLNDYFANPYLTALTVLIGSYLFMILIKELIVRKISILTRNTQTAVDDRIISAVKEIGFLFYIAVPLWISVQFLELRDILLIGVKAFALIIITFNAIEVSRKIGFGLIQEYINRKYENTENDQTVLQIAKFTLTAGLWAGGILLVLQNLGYNITTLLGGLGIAGVAVAFGLKSILEDMFSFFSIYFDKPFNVGDTIVVGQGQHQDRGTVKKVGIKSTRLQTLTGEELIVSNNELTNTRISNFKKMEKRRVSFRIGVTYDTPLEKLKKIPPMVEDTMNDLDNVEFSRCKLRELADSSISFQIVYYIDDRDVELYLDRNHTILERLLERLEKEGIELAFPTQTVKMAR